MMVPKVISFYTPNTPYQQEAQILECSCKKFDIKFQIEAVESKGSWEQNVAMKPRYILEKRKTMDGPLLWIDADGAFLQEPDFSLFEGVDFSVRFMSIFQDEPRHSINTATIYIADTKEAFALCKAWADQADYLLEKGRDAPFLDQIALYDVLLENKGAKVLPLPTSYCKIYDMDQFFIDQNEVVIEQRQVSREHR